LALQVEHPLAQGRQPVVPAPRIVELRRRALARLHDQPFLDQPLQGAIQGGRPEAHLTVGTLQDVLHDAVAVLLAADERQENVEPIALERQKTLRALSGHRPYVYQLISISVKTL